MKLSSKEKQVLDFVRQNQATTKKDLCQHLLISHMTMVRALKKYGYYTSYNKNSAYYTPHGIPNFDEFGLWSWNDIGFSRYGTLQETIVSLVENSSEGLTVDELEKRLRAKVGNVICRLLRWKRPGRFYAGRNVVYVCRESGPQSIQRSKRQSRKFGDEKSHIAVNFREKRLPEGVDPITVIHILIQLIKKPEASVASLSLTLQAEDIEIKAEQIHRVLQFYSLEKKTAH